MNFFKSSIEFLCNIISTDSDNFLESTKHRPPEAALFDIFYLLHIKKKYLVHIKKLRKIWKFHQDLQHTE